MRFIKIINNNRFVLINIFLFIFVLLNLLDGERGLISYFEKNEIKKSLIGEKKYLISKLEIMEKKNSLLTTDIDLDYLETIYRKKLMVGKKDERVYLTE
tara:strand:+ start:1608 stop:1904 length:297 start_codon:yes stop_codon:yes gene_type:complete